MHGDYNTILDEITFPGKQHHHCPYISHSSEDRRLSWLGLVAD